MLKSWLRQQISNKFPNIDFDILTPPDDKMGDYSINLAFVVAKRLGVGSRGGALARPGNSVEKINPMEAGKDLVSEFSGDKEFGKK
ncbi:MAG: hypothetical protein AAB801_02310, partial [Patescibacteria group bacterium]